MDDENPGVYILHNPNNDKLYVGSTVDLNERKRKHFQQLRNNKHINKKLQNAFNKDPQFEFVGVPTLTREDAYEVEQQIIEEHYGNPLFLNIARDAKVPCLNCSPEIREKIRQSNTGKKASEETRLKMSNTQKLVQTGKTLSEETKAKISASHIGKKLSEETKAKLSLIRKNKEMPEEQKQKISQSNMGHSVSEDTRKILSEKAKERWNNPEMAEKYRESRIGMKLSETHVENMRKVGIALFQTEEGREKRLKAVAIAQEKNRIPVVVNGIKYASKIEAMKTLRIGKPVLNRLIENGVNMQPVYEGEDHPSQTTEDK